MTAEEIYPLIDDNDDTETLDQHVYDAESDGESQRAAASDGPPRPDKSHGAVAETGRHARTASLSDDQRPEARQDDSGQGKASAGKTRTAATRRQRARSR